MEFKKTALELAKEIAPTMRCNPADLEVEIAAVQRTQRFDFSTTRGN